jgi:hypothetical protein
VRAYRRDIAGQPGPAFGVDGMIVGAATMVDHIVEAPTSDLRRLAGEANRIALDALLAAFPDALIPRALPGSLEIGPLLALAESIGDRLPTVAEHLVRQLMIVDARDRGLSLPQDFLEGEGPEEDLATMERMMAATIDSYNAAPQEELAGLSPNQIVELTAGDWTTTGPIRLDPTIRLEDLDGAALLHDARMILTHLRDVGPLAATATGNLTRGAVAELRPKLRVDHKYLDKGYFKVINEPDVFWLWVARNLLVATRMIARRGTHFQLRKRGRAAAADDGAGELFAILFTQLFQRTNLGVFDRWGDGEVGLSATMGCTLYLLSRHGTTWQSAEDLAERAWLKTARDAPSPGYAGDWPGRAQHVFASRVLRPMVVLGLMEERDVRPSRLEPRVEYRVLPLFQRFVRFEGVG